MCHCQPKERREDEMSEDQSGDGPGRRFFVGREEYLDELRASWVFFWSYQSSFRLPLNDFIATFIFLSCLYPFVCTENKILGVKNTSVNFVIMLFRVLILKTWIQ